MLNQVTNWDTFSFDDYPGLATVGKNGVGAAASQCTSEWFEVKSYRDGECLSMQYRDGFSIWDEPKSEPTDEPNGTWVSWKPDDRVFTATNIPSARVRRLCEDTSIVANVTVNYTNPSGDVESFAANTISTYFEEMFGDVAYNKVVVPTTEDGVLKVCEAECAVSPTGQGRDVRKFYQNYITISEGVHSKQTDAAIEAFFNELGANNGVKIKAGDFQGMISVIVSDRATHVGVKGQTKSNEESVYIGTAVYRAVLGALQREAAKGTGWLSDILEKVIEIAQIRIQAENARKQIRELVRKTSSTNRKLPSKFTPCTAYNAKRYTDVEIFIAEGDSAGDHIVQARDGDTQAVFRIRGKSLNLFKASIDQILQNRESLDLVQILGAGVDTGSGLGEDYDTFDINKLRCGKLIIASDADADGYHIRMLVTVLVWRLFPQIIDNGMLYVAESPLFRLEPKNKRGEVLFFYNNKEFNDWANARGGTEGYTPMRNKGLGQMQAEELRDTTIYGPNRHLRQIKFDTKDPEINDVLEVLFGTSTDQRKRAIMTSLMTGEESFDEMIDAISELEDEIAGLDIEDDIEYETVVYA